jgi:hypothetical protein
MAHGRQGETYVSSSSWCDAAGSTGALAASFAWDHVNMGPCFLPASCCVWREFMLDIYMWSQVKD